MARITYYTNSFLANVAQFVGYCALALGVMVLLTGDVFEGALCILIALVLMFAASRISANKAFNKWWHQVEAANLEPEIRRSRDTAVEIYRKNPQKRTLEKIRELNPAAAAYIENGFKEIASSNQHMTSTPAQQTNPAPALSPVQQPVYQTPVQQNTYQPPVQTSVIRANGKEYASLDEYIDEVAKTFNANTQHDPEIYWQCYSKLEWLLEVYPDNDRLLMNLANAGARYASVCYPQTLEEHRRAFNAAVSSLSFGASKPNSREIDIRKFNLIVHAVNGGIDAGNTRDIKWMEAAAKWLRTASGYWFENPDERGEQYRNVAIPSVRAYVGYWLAKGYLAENPANKQKARSVLEEVLHCCPFALIRSCDINPNLSKNTQTILTREQILELWNMVA